MGTKLGDSDLHSVQRILLGVNDQAILAGGWNERAENVRAKNLTNGKALWSLPGNLHTLGLCRGSDGRTVLLQRAGKTSVLTRVTDDGKLQPWPSGELQRLLPETNFNGLAELGGILYFSSDSGVIYSQPVVGGELRKAFQVERPMSLVADRQRDWLWMIAATDATAERTLSAYSPDGTRKATIASVTSPLGVAVRENYLAVAGYESGKIHILDITDANQPKTVRTIGRGDGPYGPIIADRFWFQKGRYTSAKEVPMDLDPSGRVALVDAHARPLVFDASGEALYASLSQFGNAPYWEQDANPSGPSRFFDPQGQQSWLVDAAKGTWRPEAYWGRPDLRHRGNATVGFFTHEGTVFGCLRYTSAGEGNAKRGGYVFLRYEDHVGMIVAFYYGHRGQLHVVRDRDHDGAITEADGEGEVVLNDAGKPVNAGNAMARFTVFEANGNIRSETRQTWVFGGVDSKGQPLYTFPDAPGFAYDAKALRSPYTFEPGPTLYSESVIATDGDLLSSVMCKDSPNGMGLSNSGALDLARFRPDGRLRWYLPLNDYGPIQGVKQVVPGFILTSWGHQGEWIALDEDGLSLGHLGFPAAANWSGYWLDHPDHYVLFPGNDGSLHILAGDYFLNGQHWLTLEHARQYRKSSHPFSISKAQADALAALPPQTAVMQARSNKPHVTIPRLDAPLPIDGALAKWRDLNLQPQIVITPSTAGPGIASAIDCSAVIRLAYHQSDLYVQVLRFDDVPTFHQTIATGTHMQDTVEMMINGFHPEGFQFSVGRFSTDGEQIVRRRFFAPKLVLNLPATLAPRVVQVLPDARDVAERELIEAATGEDLSEAKVIITEFKLPIDTNSWAGSENTLFPVVSGGGFWLGFMIDDNDAPGTNLQKLAVWPASFSTFSTKEDSAWVTFE